MDVRTLVDHSEKGGERMNPVVLVLSRFGLDFGVFIEYLLLL